MPNCMLRGLLDFDLPPTPKGARLVQFDNSGRAVPETVRAVEERSRYLARQREMSERQRNKHRHVTSEETEVRPFEELLYLINEVG